MEEVVVLWLAPGLQQIFQSIVQVLQNMENGNTAGKYICYIFYSEFNSE